MSRLAAVPVFLVLTIGHPSPIDRVNGFLYRPRGAPQGAVQGAVQTSCPTLRELDAGSSTLLTVSAPVDGMSRKIGAALNNWANPATRDPNRALRRAAGLIVEPESVQTFDQRPASNTVGRTCFFEWRSGYSDTRIAFKFSARATSASKGKTTTTIEVRWLSQTKGSAQRTWRDSPPEADPLNKLLELLRKELGG